MKRMIGKMGIETSALGMGCWAIGGEWDFMGHPAGWGQTDNNEAVRAVHAAFDNGIRLFDTAAAYGAGHSEILLGKALGKRRKDCIVVSNFGYDVDVDSKSVSNYGDSQVKADVISHLKADCEASLRRLGMESIDVYLLHIGDFDSQLAGDLIVALEDLVHQGKINSYGWSTDAPEKIQLWTSGTHFSSIENNFHIAADAPEITGICKTHNLTALSRGPLAMGFLTGKYTINTRFSETDVRSSEWVIEGFQKPIMKKLDDLKDILTSNGRSLAQGALAWIWAKSDYAIPIPGIRTVGQAEENANAMSFGPLNTAELAQIECIMGR